MAILKNVKISSSIITSICLNLDHKCPMVQNIISNRDINFMHIVHLHLANQNQYLKKILTSKVHNKIYITINVIIFKPLYKGPNIYLRCHTRINILNTIVGHGLNVFNNMS